jgi:hypothetical protein
MRKALRLATALAVAAALTPLTSGCAVGRGEPLVVGDMVTENQTFELGEVRSLDVDLSVNIGSLRVTGGADDLASVEFRYNVPDWKPEVDYSANGDHARLTIAQPDHQNRSVPDEAKNSWEIQLNSDVPLTLNLDMGIGESVLVLGGTSTTAVDVEQGIGEMTIDLTGEWHSDLDVNIDGGIGEATIRVPEGVGVRVVADTGIGGISTLGFTRQGGAYVNAAYGESDTTIEIDVDAGIGSITIQVGNESTAQI